jgi:hypothetical protein
MAKKQKCFVVAHGGRRAFFPVARKATRKAAEREKRRLMRQGGVYHVRNVCR